MKEKLEDNQISRNKKIIKEIGGWIICIVIAVILALLIKYFILTPTVVKQESMYPTLEENQRLILNRLGRTFKQMPKRGDIITFEAPTVTYRTEEDTDISNPVAIKSETTVPTVNFNFSGASPSCNEIVFSPTVLLNTTASGVHSSIYIQVAKVKAPIAPVALFIK